MEDVKSWLASRAVWGGIIAVLSALAGLFGYTVAETDQVALVEAIAGIGAAVGGVIAIWGRIKATKKIGA